MGQYTSNQALRAASLVTAPIKRFEYKRDEEHHDV